MKYEYVQTIKQRVEYIASFIEDANVKDTPIQVKSHQEFYKNGNVKAYVSHLSIQNPSKAIIVRNRNHGLYKENFNDAYEYLNIYYYSEKYNLLKDSFFDIFSTYHLNVIDEFYDFEDYIQEKLSIYTFNPLPEKLKDDKKLMKPSKYDKKYKYVPHFWHNIFGGGNRKKKRLNKKYMKSLSKYEKGLEYFDQKKLQYYDENFKLSLENSIIQTKRIAVQQNLKKIEESYIALDNEKLVQKYFDILINRNYTPNNLFKDEVFVMYIDIDTRTIISDISIPTINKYPYIESYNPIKKHKRANYKSFTKSERSKQASNIVMSHFMYITLLLQTIDEYNHFNKLVINVYDNNEVISSDNCIYLTKVNFNSKNIYNFTDGLVRDDFQELTGNIFDYSTIDHQTTPITKGGEK